MAFSGAKTDSTADEAAPAVADNTVTRTANGNQYLIPFEATICYAAALNDTITRAQFSYPSMRDVGIPELFPLNALAEPSANFNVWVPGMNGPKVRKTEEFGAQSSNGASTVDTIHICAGLMDAITPIPPGRRFTVRGTAAQTLVASAWTSAPIALGTTLPPGRYAVIGLRVTCNDGVFGRLVFPGNLSFRPGCVCGETIAIDDPMQSVRNGKLGLLGVFEQTAPPQLEILGGTAGAETPAVILDMVDLNGR